MAALDAGRPLPPYLGSWALALLAFTSPVVLSLLLTIVRLVLAIESVNTSISHAKQDLAASCNGLEQAASVAVSFPHYMAANFNGASVRDAEAVIDGLGEPHDANKFGDTPLTFCSSHGSRYVCGCD